jgi:hypothetical protein
LICAVTGHTEESYLLKAKNSGIQRVLCKPAQEIDIKQLLEIIALNKEPELTINDI